jgi:predicted small secreted protein
MKKMISMVIALSAVLLLSACNTMSGLGDDIQAAGGAIKTTAVKAKEKVSN